ncbi:MAG: SIS domain-containing protein, partial [Terrimicrobiaceae bacterium]|nr:SIS domain-containing protein [Terrimicrobiaceae bacterium]
NRPGNFSAATSPLPGMNNSSFLNSLEELRGLLQDAAALREPLEAAARCVAESLCAGGKLLVCGNGGSAAESAHLATEFTCRFCEDRRPYPAIALTADGGLLTAVGNDYSFDQVFARQVRGYGRPGDVLIAFTTSGKSPNVLLAIEEARACGLRSIAFLGKGGGPAKGRAEIELIVPSQTTARIQEVHQFLLHALCEIVEQSLPRA